MTSRERIFTVLKGEIPDCVPVCPDISNMVPCRLTGKPFWDIYLYQNPPLWKAHIDAVKYFGFDGIQDGYAEITTEIDGVECGMWGPVDKSFIEVIVKRTPDRIITQHYREENGGKVWNERVTVYYIDNPPTWGVRPEALGLPKIPGSFEEIKGVKQWPKGGELLKLIKEEMGDHGVVGIYCGTTCLISNDEEVLDFYDNPEKYYEKRDNLLIHLEKRFYSLMEFEYKPDFIAMGYSGSLIFQTLQTFRELGLPILKKISALCKEYGIPSHVHSCGPEAQLVKIAAEETDLTVIDPLEIPPMGNCDLAQLKKDFGDKIVLKGNLHTTNIMLNGAPGDVEAASKQAIDDAAAGGRFILSTGDQCGRDTPDENIFTMIKTARTYGRYDK